MRSEKEREQRRKKRSENRSIFLRTAYCTAVILAAALLFYLPLTGEEQEAAEEIQVEKPGDFRLAVFLEDGFEQSLGPVFLLRFSGSAQKLTITALPPQTDLFGGSLSLRFRQEGPVGVLSRLADEGVFLSEYVCLSRENCQKITRNFGDLHYRLGAPLSYYDPRTGDSFLAPEGYNAASGQEYCKLCTLFCRTDPAEGAGLSAELFLNYLQNFPAEEEKKERLAVLLEGAERSSFQAESADRLRRCLSWAFDAEVCLLPPAGELHSPTLLPGERFETLFLPSGAFCSELQLLFASA